MTSYAIQTEGLCLSYRGKPALDRLSLAIAHGGIHAVIGANGAGKSSLFRVLLGFETATAGSAHILGCDSTRLTPELRGRIGFVNEEHSLPGWMRVAELTAMQRRLHAGWRQARFDEVVRHFNVWADQRIAQLSRGERAGVNLALALAQSPALLILDEPTLGLDVVAKRAFLEALMFGNLADESTIVYCSHQMDEVERLADQLVILERGALRCLSAPDALRARVRLWVAELPPRERDPRSLPGVLLAERIDGMVHLLVLDQGEAFGASLRDLGARSVHAMDVSLERAVNALLSRGHIANQPLPAAA